MTDTTYNTAIEKGQVLDSALTVAMMYTVFNEKEKAQAAASPTEDSDADLIIARVREVLPKATAAKLRSLKQDITLETITTKINKGQKEERNFDDFDHSHFGIFSAWCEGFIALITASINTLKNSLRAKKQANTKDQIPWEWAVAILFVVPLILLPLLIHVSKQAQKAWQQLSDYFKPNYLITTMLLAVLVPFYTLLRIITGADSRSIQEIKEAKEKEASYPLMKIFARGLVIFAALGTGFIAFAAIISVNSPLACIGVFAWLFFVAGFLSEFQSLEMSVYNTFCKVIKYNFNIFFWQELKIKMAYSRRKYWGSNEKLVIDEWAELSDDLKRELRIKKGLQVGALAFSFTIGASMFAIAFTHSQIALLMLAGASSLLTAPWWVMPLVFLIAGATAVAWTCMVYRVLRDAIHDQNGNNFISLWGKYIYDSCVSLLKWDKNDKWYVKLSRPFMPIAFLALLALTLFYVVTAAPVFREATQIVFRSEVFTWLLSGSYYIIMSIYYAGACQKSFEELKEYLSFTGKNMGGIFVGTWQAAREAWVNGKKGWRVLLVPLFLFEGLLKFGCYLILHITLTLGLFLLHLLGDAAVPSEDKAPFGMSKNLMLVLNALSHFLSDIGFLLEWSLGCSDHDHIHEEIENLNNEINLGYALLCTTIIIPWLHVGVYSMAKAVNYLSNNRWAQNYQKLHPAYCLFKNKDKIQEETGIKKVASKQFAPINADDQVHEEEDATKTCDQQPLLGKPDDSGSSEQPHAWVRYLQRAQG